MSSRFAEFETTGTIHLVDRVTGESRAIPLDTYTRMRPETIDRCEVYLETDKAERARDRIKAHRASVN